MRVNMKCIPRCSLRGPGLAILGSLCSSHTVCYHARKEEHADKTIEGPIYFLFLGYSYPIYSWVCPGLKRWAAPGQSELVRWEKEAGMEGV